MGNVSNSRKQILLNTLDEEVSKYFDVSPPTNVSSGELPVVSDVFQLQIVEEDGDTQLTLRWMSGNERKVETNLCGGCKTIELNENLKELVEKLFGKKKIEPVVEEEKREMVVLFLRKVNGKLGWFWEGDENKDTKYVGEIEKGLPHGMGTITYGKGKWEGQKYIGEWKDGKYSQGTFTWSEGKWKGDKYVGEFKDGVFHGQGTRTWSEGDKFVGEYKNGERNGQGIYTWSDGRKYVGEWKDGKRNGQGTRISPDGTKYVGEYKNGEYHGQGTYTFGKGKWEGDKYVGEHKDGKRHGQGTYTWSDGRKYVGEWNEDKEWNGTEYDKNENIKVKFVNGKEIKQ